MKGNRSGMKNNFARCLLVFSLLLLGGGGVERVVDGDDGEAGRLLQRCLGGAFQRALLLRSAKILRDDHHGDAGGAGAERDCGQQRGG